MITVSDTARALIDSGSYVYVVRASAWLGDDLLAESIPIESGGDDSDRSLRVPERITLTIPRRQGGVDWSPTSDTDPLAAKGQTIRLELGVGIGTDGIEWFQRGEYLILEVSATATTVELTAVGQLYLIDEAKFAAPFQPAGTFQSTLRKLLEPAVTVDLDLSPANRSIPASAASWESDRLGAVLELLDSWPAQAQMSNLGVLVVTPDSTPTVAVRSFTDGVGGTVVSASGASTRGSMTNMVMVTGYDATGAEVRAAAYADVPAGWQAAQGTDQQVILKWGAPWAYAKGPNPMPKPSTPLMPLIRTIAEAAAAAKAALRRKMRQGTVREFTIEAVPDPTLEIGDAVAITSTDAGITDLLCTIEALNLPYEPGVMTLRVVTAI